MPIQHVVRRGEGIDSIAFLYGFFPLTVWNAPENAALRAARTDRNILQEGDLVFVPDKRVKTVSAATGMRHVFRRRGVPAMFRLQALKQGAPRANVAFVLVVDGVEHQGTTDANGMVELFVPPDAKEGELRLGGGAPIRIQFGEIEPISSIRGVQQRLNNLGFPCGASGTLDDDTADALRRFQTSAGLQATGALDDTTSNKLLQLHDTPAVPSQGSAT